MRVPAQGAPAIVQRELLDFDDRISRLEQAAGRLVPQIVKVQIVDVQHLASLAKCTADRPGLKRKNPIFVVILAADYLPRFRRVFEPANLVPLGRVL